MTAGDHQHDDDEAPALILSTTAPTNPWEGRKVGGGLDGPNAHPLEEHYRTRRPRPKPKGGHYRRDAGRV